VDANAKLVTYNSNYPIGVNTSVTQPADGTFSIKSVEDTGFAVAGYKFTGWNRAKDGTSTIMSVGDERSIENDITLFAQWRPYEITYDMNGGSDDKEFSEEIDNKTLGTGTVTSKIPSQKYDYYTFLGWSKSDSATTATYKAGSSISVTDDTKLYAVWKLGTIVEEENIDLSGAIGLDEKFTIIKTENLVWDIYCSNGVDFYIKDAGGNIVKSEINVKTQKVINVSLKSGTYSLLVRRDTRFGTKSAKCTLKSAD
jgi:uncharacterized repeat protein (TIGR02543 family)